MTKFNIGQDRDLGHEIRRVIDEEVENSGPTWSTASVALRVVARLREQDPELLTKWLDLVAVDVVRGQVQLIIRNLRLDARRHSLGQGASVFAGAVKRYEEGEKQALGAWLETVYIVNVKNHRKQLGDMDRDDLLFAATDYTNRARSNSMQAAFLRALADRVGARTVREVIDDAELTRMWRSLT